MWSCTVTLGRRDGPQSASVGDPVAVSGPGRGYEIDPEADPLILLGDETALPAIGQLLEATPQTVPVSAHIEVARPDARIPLPEHPNATITWHELSEGAPPGTTLLDVVSDQPLTPGTRIWAAGEAAGVQRLRKLLFAERSFERSFERSRASVRGYWKVGRAGPGLD